MVCVEICSFHIVTNSLQSHVELLRLEVLTTLAFKITLTIQHNNSYSNTIVVTKDLLLHFIMV